MTLTWHELRQSKNSLMIWTVSIGCLMAVCIFLFPEIKSEMSAISAMFASMGSFSAAFGMDKVSFGTLPGFYAIECGNILGLGGSLFASLCGISILAKEEKEHTAEFLLTHPVSRGRIVTEKLIAVLLQITFLNIVVLLLSFGSIAAIGEKIPLPELLLLHLAYFLLDLEIGAICFGISAFIRRGSLGIGLGIAAVLYFLNLIANLSEHAEFLKFITPFGYSDGASIVANVRLDASLAALGMVYGAVGICAAYIRYGRKDIA